MNVWGEEFAPSSVVYKAWGESGNMSRPPNNSNSMSSNFDASRGRVIDFVQPLGCQYHPDYAIYSQAGFPGFDPVLAAQYSNIPPGAAYTNPAYTPLAVSSQYTALNALGSAYTPPTAYNPHALASAYNPTPHNPSAYHYNTLASPTDSKELHQKIESRIDTILQQQKAEALQSKIENLTEQVRTLSRSMELGEFRGERRSSMDNNNLRSSMDNLRRDDEYQNNSINSKLQQLIEDSRRQELKFAS